MQKINSFVTFFFLLGRFCSIIGHLFRPLTLDILENSFGVIVSVHVGEYSSGVFAGSHSSIHDMSELDDRGTGG